MSALPLRHRPHGHRLWPPMVLPTTPHVAEVGDDLLREQFGVLLGTPFIQIAELAKHHQMADVEHLDGILQTFTHGSRAAGDHIALFDKILPREVFAYPLRFVADLRADASADGLDRSIARGLGIARIDMQA